MPTERRCPNSGARIFMPTQSEMAHIESLKQLKKELSEVQEMKSQLKQMMEDLKNKKK